jgi:hypothetical protein
MNLVVPMNLVRGPWCPMEPVVPMNLVRGAHESRERPMVPHGTRGVKRARGGLLRLGPSRIHKTKSQS